MTKALLSGASLLLVSPMPIDSVAAQDLTPDEVRQIGQQSRLIERDRIELEGRFESMEAAQQSGNCFIFEQWSRMIDEFLDAQIGQYGPPTNLPSRRNVFQAAETRLERIRALGCPLPGTPATGASVTPATTSASTPAPEGPAAAPAQGNADPSAGPPVILTDEQRNLGTDWSPELRDYFIKFLFGGGQADVPQTGTGFRRDGAPGTAPEVDAVLTENKVSTIGVELEFGFPVGGTRMRLDGSYEEGDASNSFEIPGNAGIDSGRVNGALSPSGSSGVATDRGLASETATEVSRLDVALSTYVLLKGRISAAPNIPTPPLEPGRVGIGLSIGAGYGIVDKLDISNIFYSGGGGGFVFEFSQDRRQKLKEQYFRVFVTSEVEIPVGERLVGHLNGRASGYYRDSDLDSVEHNLCNFCPPADRDFTIEINDSDNGFGFRGEAGAALELRLSPTVSIYAGGSVDYWSEVGAIFNPNSGDQVFFDGLTTGLRTEDAWSWKAGGGLIVRFGGGR